MESREEPCRAMNVLFSAPCVLRGTALARLGRASTSADISRRLTGRHSMSSAAHTAPARILCSYCCSCRNVFVSSSLDPHSGYESYIQDSTLRFFRYLVRLRGPENGRTTCRPTATRAPGPGAAPATGRYHRARRSPAGSAAAHGDGPVAAYAKLAARGELRERPASVARAATHTHHSDPRRLRLLSTPHSRQYTLQSDRNSVLYLSRFSLLSTLDRCLRSRHCRLVSDSQTFLSRSLSSTFSLSHRAHAETFQSGVARTVCHNLV